MAIIRWEPFRLEDMPEFRVPRFGSNLAVDVYEKGKNVIAEMNLPGVNPDEITIDVEDDYVRVLGKREVVEENEKTEYYYQEIQRGEFERTFRLPAKVDSTKSTAEFDDGVLTLTMPKSEEKKIQKLKITQKDKSKAPQKQAKKQEKISANSIVLPIRRPAMATEKILLPIHRE